MPTTDDHPAQPDASAPPATDDVPGSGRADAPVADRTGRRTLPVGPVGLLLATALAAAAALGFIWLTLGNRDSATVLVQNALEAPPDTAPVVPDGSSPAQIGAPAPNVQLNYLDGGTQRLSELRRTPVVLSFWSSTCAACLAQMPAVQQVSRAAAGKVTVVGVDVTDPAAVGDQAVARTGVTYRNARDPRSAILAIFGGTTAPRTVLIDAAGTVVEASDAAVNAESLTAMLRRNGMLP